MAEGILDATMQGLVQPEGLIHPVLGAAQGSTAMVNNVSIADLFLGVKAVDAG